MRVKIDGENCTGHARCFKYAPHVFDLDDDGYNADRGGEVEVAPGQEAAAHQGIKSCPERAITLVSE
jgi:ferredoxin